MLAAWIVANTAVFAFLVVHPQVTRSVCDGHWVDAPVHWLRSVTSDEEFVSDLCGVQTHPLAERGEVLVGAVIGNGLVLTVWSLARPSTDRPTTPVAPA